MVKYISPLRYPGGKSKLIKYLIKIINQNQTKEYYVEPFAGGAGAALKLLVKNYVKNIILNDADNGIYNFWYSILNNTEELIYKIEKTPIDINNWKKQKSFIYDKNLYKNLSTVDIGFATFYLNRCNRSGILSGGPIGGYNQLGKWKINARFNKNDLIDRIKLIASLKKHIQIFNLDALVFLKNCSKNTKLNVNNTLVYLDPPYFEKGRMLYDKHYDKEDHQMLQNFLQNDFDLKWILSYDDVSFIRELYKDSNKNNYFTNHFVYKARLGNELIILSDNCVKRNFQTLLFTNDIK